METLHRGSKFLGQVFSFFGALFSIAYRAHLKTNAWHACLRSYCRAYSHAEVLLNPVCSLGRWWQCWLCNSPPCYWQASSSNYNLPSGHDLRGVRRDGRPLLQKGKYAFQSPVQYWELILNIWDICPESLLIIFQGFCSWWHLCLWYFVESLWSSQCIKEVQPEVCQ